MMSIRISFLTVLLIAPAAPAFGPWCSSEDRPVNLEQLNQQLQGKIHDYTANHGEDRRIHSTALNQKRDVYVYVPPGYDPSKRYPLVIWLHGLAQDESGFLQVVSKLDAAMSLGVLPKFVAIAPDGTVRGRASLREPPSMFLNSPQGRFEDYIVYDVWNHAVNNYGIRPERGAHVLAGASLGAFGAYNLAIKYRKDYGVVAGVLPPLNLRYADCRGRTDTDYDPNCTGMLEEYRPYAPVARFGFLMTIRQRQIVAPVFGEGPDVIAKIAADNPAEMLTSYNVKPGELEMFAGYGQFDEFNFDAQTESFAAIARARGLTVQAVMVPNGKHDKETAMMLVPEFVKWLRPKLEPYSPK